MSEKSNNKEVIVFTSPTFLNKTTQYIIENFVTNTFEDYRIIVYYFNIYDEENDCISTWRNNPKFQLIEVTKELTLPNLTSESIIFDALFGFDLQAPLTGGFSALVQFINKSDATIFSLAAPSGLLPTDNSTNAQNIIKATYSLLLQEPPLAYYFPENQDFFGEIIGKECFGKAYNVPKFTTKKEIAKIYKPRKRFSHKGTYGKGLLIAGSYGMAGAANLSGMGALKSGIGLLVLHCPNANRIIHQTVLPEAVLSLDLNELCFTQIVDLEPCDAVAVGPGLGLSRDSEIAVENLLMERTDKENPIPVIIDADGINLIGGQTDLLEGALKDTILTPHPLEMDRLIGFSSNSYIRLQKAIGFAREHQSYIVLKGAYSFLIFPDGDYQLNPTGNAGMATGGSGDVLTGILLSLVAQGYSLKESIILGSYVHGLAGDIAAKEKGEIGMTAKDIAEALPKAWLEVHKLANE